MLAGAHYGREAIAAFGLAGPQTASMREIARICSDIVRVNSHLFRLKPELY